VKDLRIEEPAKKVPPPPPPPRLDDPAILGVSSIRRVGVDCGADGIQQRARSLIAVSARYCCSPFFFLFMSS
jgi:hypothetical protein